MLNYLIEPTRWPIYRRLLSRTIVIPYPTYQISSRELKYRTLNNQLSSPSALKYSEGTLYEEVHLSQKFFSNLGRLKSAASCHAFQIHAFQIQKGMRFQEQIGAEYTAQETWSVIALRFDMDNKPD